MTRARQPSAPKVRELERHIQRRIVDLLRAAGAEVIENRSQKFDALLGAMAGNKSGKGTVDLIAAIPGGVTLWIEVKADGGKASPEQDAHHQRLVALGHIVIVTRNHEDISGAVFTYCARQDHEPEDVIQFAERLRSA